MKIKSLSIALSTLMVILLATSAQAACGGGGGGGGAGAGAGVSGGILGRAGGRCAAVTPQGRVFNVSIVDSSDSANTFTGRMTFSDKTFTFGTMGQDKIAYTWKKSGTSMTISGTAGLATLTGTITDNQFKGTLSVTDKAGKVKSWIVATAEADSKKAK